ncbi:MAG: RtcB family protein [Planctomycetes bacterium]|nr:RtcB family protein [Planctomycetota bacterium]
MSDKAWHGPLDRIDDCRWKIPRSYKHGMHTDGLIYADDEMIKQVVTDNAPEQVANVAFLPGIVGRSMAMPDIHWGYGFPIGGCAATDPEEGGVVSPGGVGYDINCGVRLVRTRLTEDQVRRDLRGLVSKLFATVPCGVGKSGHIRFSHDEERKLVAEGARYVVRRGYGRAEDLDHTEANGCLDGADPDVVSHRAYERGAGQCGTLGSGNHFVEVQVVDEVYDQAAAEAFGLGVGSVTVMIHSGSRGFGYQICDEYVNSLVKAAQKYQIGLPDRQLACAPVNSPEGQRYLGAMRCAANYAWANRQALMHLVRLAFEEFFQSSPAALGMDLIYDVAHNIAKMEKHAVGGRERTLCVHRKGATRAFPPGHPEVPAEYRHLGQPVIIPGDMGRASYLLVGTQKAMEESFGTTCHGAGRVMSRTQAIKSAHGRDVARRLADQGIVVRGTDWKGLAEEQPAAYKDVNHVVEVVHRAGLSRKVCRMRPLGVIKG